MTLDIGYWYNNKENPAKITLGFDSSTAMHTYGFAWSPSHISATVDGNVVWTVAGQAGVDLPGNAMQVLSRPLAVGDPVCLSAWSCASVFGLVPRCPLPGSIDRSTSRQSDRVRRSIRRALRTVRGSVRRGRLLWREVCIVVVVWYNNTDTQTHRQTHRHTDRQTGRQAGRQTDTQTHRHTQTDTHRSLVGRRVACSAREASRQSASHTGMPVPRCSKSLSPCRSSW